MLQILQQFKAKEIDRKKYKILQSGCNYLCWLLCESKRGVQFRIWAINLIKEYMKKGFVLDDERLKELDGGKEFEIFAQVRNKSKENLKLECVDSFEISLGKKLNYND